MGKTPPTIVRYGVRAHPDGVQRSWGKLLPRLLFMESEHAPKACAAWGLPTIGIRTSPEVVGSQGVSNCRCCRRICCRIRRLTLRRGECKVWEVAEEVLT